MVDFFRVSRHFLGQIFSRAFLVQKLINTYNRLILSCPLCPTGTASTTTMSILRLDGERSHITYFKSVKLPSFFFDQGGLTGTASCRTTLHPTSRLRRTAASFQSKTENLDSERLFKILKSKSNRYGSLLIPNVGSIRTEFLMACAAGLRQNVLLIGEQVAHDDDDDGGDDEDGTISFL